MELETRVDVLAFELAFVLNDGLRKAEMPPACSVRPDKAEAMLKDFDSVLEYVLTEVGVGPVLEKVASAVSKDGERDAREGIGYGKLTFASVLYKLAEAAQRRCY